MIIRIRRSWGRKRAECVAINQRLTKYERGVRVPDVEKNNAFFIASTLNRFSNTSKDVFRRCRWRILFPRRTLSLLLLFECGTVCVLKRLGQSHQSSADQNSFVQFLDVHVSRKQKQKKKKGRHVVFLMNAFHLFEKIGRSGSSISRCLMDG